MHAVAAIEDLLKHCITSCNCKKFLLFLSKVWRPRRLYLPLPYLESTGTISLILFFQWCSKSTPVSLSSERFLQLHHRTEVIKLYFFIHCKQENSQIISDVRLGFETILPRHVGWQTSVIGSNCLITLLCAKLRVWNSCWELASASADSNSAENKG